MDPNIITVEDITEVREHTPYKDLDPGDYGARENGCTRPYYPNRTRNTARKKHDIFYVNKNCPVHGWIQADPTYAELRQFAIMALKIQPRALQLVEALGIDDLNDPMQRLAFQIYTEIVRLDQNARSLMGLPPGEKIDLSVP